jgi:hypothetical protein
MYKIVPNNSANQNLQSQNGADLYMNMI